PHRLIRRHPASVNTAIEGEVQTFEVEIDAYLKPRTPAQPWKMRCYDGTGFLTLTYFGSYGGRLEASHPVGARRIVSGKVERFGSEWQIAHPDYLVAPDKADELPLVAPVCPATAGLPARTVRRFALDSLDRAPERPEWQDPAWLARERFPAWREALARLHAPQSESDLSPQAPHQRRLAYDELLAHQLAMAQRKAERRAEPAPKVAPGPSAARLTAALPFALTGPQRRALAHIRHHRADGERMSRPLPRDRGPGKTVVCMLAMADIIDGGGQAALMAPTEILARQHFETLAGPLQAQGISVVLLTGRDRGAPRAEKLRAIASGAIKVAVGTHALFQDEVTFQRLQMALIDEQHRFGVAERQRLQAKGEAVHLLAMSATPIPRTLELTIYGDLDVSRIDEKPPGRTPVATRASPMTRVHEVEARLEAAVKGGAQAFWICPLVAESEVMDLKAAEVRAR